MCRAAQFAFVDVRVRVSARRVKHAQFDPGREEANERGVHRTFGQITLLHGLNIRFVVILVQVGLGAEAFVVHTTHDRNGRGLG